MKFGFDIHGVIDTRPQFFKTLMRALREAGAEVHVLSGPPQAQCFRELEDMGFVAAEHYTHVFSIVDALKAQGVKMWQDERGHWWSDPYLWDKAKGEYCERNQIDLHFDDSDTYRYFFKTPFARFFSRDTDRINKIKVRGENGREGTDDTFALLRG